MIVRQDEDFLYYRSIRSEQGKTLSDDDDLALVKDYFSLDVKIEDLYTHWCKVDPHFEKKASDEFKGIRILRQDPWENLCSFICSSNNNIKRISQMVTNLCKYFGPLISSYQGRDYYGFPDPDVLQHPDIESKLRSLGFGYRAKYIQQTARLLQQEKGGTEYLHALRSLPYREAHDALLQFTGVGPKVADCVCLMSLDKTDCIPVDTHVWQIAVRDYKVGRGKALNKALYATVGDYFRTLWGPYAGWAHSILFAADLSDLNNGINLPETSSQPIIAIADKKQKEQTIIIKSDRDLILNTKRTRSVVIAAETVAKPKIEHQRKQQSKRIKVEG